MKLSSIVASLFAVCASSMLFGAQNQSAQTQTSVSSDIQWVTDFEKAKSLAKKDSKPLFLYFTGSDWCPWCKKMDKEILSTPEFQQAMANKAIFVKVDFPRQTKLDEKTKSQNEKLSSTYKVKGFPTVVLLDSNLNVIDTLNYKAGGGAAYAKKVQDVLDAYNKKS